MTFELTGLADQRSKRYQTEKWVVSLISLDAVVEF